MRALPKFLFGTLVVAVFAISSFFAIRFKHGGLWHGLTPAVAANANRTSGNYELKDLRVVNQVIVLIRGKYVDQKRVKAKDMLLSALNYVQRDVAQIIVTGDENSPTVKVRVDTQEKEFKVDNVLGPWDISAKLKEIFTFIQEGLKGTDVDLREVEYAACNGMLHTLDPHSVLLSPEAFKEMNLSTTGQFGGLGIVISIRDQQLTVMNPMPGTPAGRAGIKKYDRIVKIDNEATLNMGLNEAVNHLRGEPATKVTVWILREGCDGGEGWTAPKPFELTREVIKVASVEHRLLEGNIGYVRLKQFQQNTANDLENALHTMRKSGELKGLVMDLRGNPGGLLDQSARVADKFLTSGLIVATVGNKNEERDEKVARVDGTEPNYPIILLVSGSSASASEIVAGAMKNHDRAVIVGETTFGKGSVQVIYSDQLPDQAALKLTIAQYLTEPGDVSIQGVGVVPDIQLDPMTVDPQEMDLTVDQQMLKERDLSRSLSNSRATAGGKPQDTLRYYLSPRDRQEFRERGGDPDEVFSLDFQIKLARDLVAKMQPGKRPEQLRALKDAIVAARNQELAAVSRELNGLGIDWTDAPGDVAQAPANAPPPNLDVKVETDRPNNEGMAGEPMNLKVTVTNKGTVALHRLSALTKSDNGYFDNRELAIGKLDPGKTKVATIPLGFCETEARKPFCAKNAAKENPRICRIPRDAIGRTDPISVKFDEARGRIPAPAQLRATLKPLDRPVFAYGYQVVDNRKGNGDGRVQRGESLTMYVTVKNVGRGKSYDTQANLRNLSGDGLLLTTGRFNLSNLAPNEVRKLSFTFDVDGRLKENEAKLELSIADRDLRESVVEKVRMPIVEASPVVAASGVVHPKSGGATLYESADGRALGHLGEKLAFPSIGKIGNFVKVDLGDSRFGFVRSSELEAGGTATPVTIDDTFQRMPPSLEFSPVALSVRDGHVMVKGTASDAERLLDAYVFVGARKVYYRSNRNGSDPKKMQIEADIPLRPGANVVSVIARETPDTVARRTFIVRRDGPGGEALATPKGEDEDALEPIEP